jgi:hypothetical protein
MALKFVNITVPVTLKCDPDDKEDLQVRLYEYLSVLMEEGELDYILEEEEDDLELED